MKPYTEQIAAIKEAIAYIWTHECEGIEEYMARAKYEKQLEDLRDAASTIIAVERDEKLYLAAGDMLEALENLSKLVSMSYAEYASANIKAKKAIEKARFG